MDGAKLSASCTAAWPHLYQGERFAPPPALYSAHRTLIPGSGRQISPSTGILPSQAQVRHRKGSLEPSEMRLKACNNQIDVWRLPYHSTSLRRTSSPANYSLKFPTMWGRAVQLRALQVLNSDILDVSIIITWREKECVVSITTDNIAIELSMGRWSMQVRDLLKLKTQRNDLLKHTWPIKRRSDTTQTFRNISNARNLGGNTNLALRKCLKSWAYI